MKSALRSGKVTIQILCLLAGGSLSGQVAQLPDEWKADPYFKNASIGFCVMDASTGAVIEQYNPNQNLIPASTLKILTTGAALSVLGNEFRYKTLLATNGSFDEKTGFLNGDLIIVGGGDPTLQSKNSPTVSIVAAWAQNIKKRGIREIKGSIIADASCVKRTIPGTWLWEDVSNYYGGYPLGLNYCDNKFQIKFSTGAAGSKASLLSHTGTYKTKSLKLTSTVTAGGTEDQAYVYGDPFSFEKRIDGTIPPNQNNYEIEAILPDPALLCAEHFYEELVKAGVKCTKNKVMSRYEAPEQPAQLTELIPTYSSPLTHLVYYTNQQSNNLYCESILLSLGDNDRKKGMQKLKGFWHGQGIDSTSYALEDACGLSRGNTVSTQILAHALSKIYQSKTVYEPFNKSLPVAGKEGSMSNIGKKTFIENNLRAKTGYVRRARSYAGYVKTRSGRTLAFSIIVNHYDCNAKEARKRLEKFLVGLAEL